MCDPVPRTELDGDLVREVHVAAPGSVVFLSVVKKLTQAQHSELADAVRTAIGPESGIRVVFVDESVEFLNICTPEEAL